MFKPGKNNLLAQLTNQIEWKLLVFLILFINVKLEIKISAIVFIYMVQSNFRFQFRFRHSRIPLFYLIMIGIAIINRLLNGRFDNLNENLAFALGLTFWTLSLLAFHQLKLFVDNTSVKKIQKTIIAFFVLNVAVSFINLIVIIWETGSLNPYRYQGMFQKYFIGTGDNIYGISFDVSTTNAILNAFGVIYFIDKKNMTMTLLCMATLLLTGSNFTNILITGVLLFMFLFNSNREQKSLMLMCMFFFIVFISRVSPENNNYAIKYFNNSAQVKEEQQLNAITDPLAYMEKPDSLLTGDEKKEKIARLYLDSLGKQLKLRAYLKENQSLKYGIVLADTRPVIPKENMNGEKYQRKSETSALQHNLIKFVKKEVTKNHIDTSRLTAGNQPGKFIAFDETYHYILNHPGMWITGAGTGNFSSKLAFKTTALGISGHYPLKWQYINNAFRENHFALYMFYFTKDARYHSIANTPNSVFNQLAGEYGFLGIAAYLFFYLGYFNKRKNLKAFLPYLILLNGAFFMDYWFEQFSIVTLFELIMLLKMKETEQLF